MESLGKRRAWKASRWALIHRLRRRLACAAVGPGRRLFNQPLSMRPTVQTWADFLAQRGPLGGQSATQVDPAHLPAVRMEDGMGYRFYAPACKEEAERDFRGI
eukprot:6307514-Pyramimonas_sp.AAC.1